MKHAQSRGLACSCGMRHLYPGNGTPGDGVLYAQALVWFIAGMTY